MGKQQLLTLCTLPNTYNKPIKRFEARDSKMSLGVDNNKDILLSINPQSIGYCPRRLLSSKHSLVQFYIVYRIMWVIYHSIHPVIHLELKINRHVRISQRIFFSQIELIHIFFLFLGKFCGRRRVMNTRARGISGRGGGVNLRCMCHCSCESKRGFHGSCFKEIRSTL